MNGKINLNDIADDLLIINKTTIDTLFKLDNCAECVALYVFYYKTAKWQKTNKIKANDLYVKKSLKWGYDKIKKTKNTLKENGLIDIVQRRKEGKIEGWYIELSYMVTERKIDDIKIKIENETTTTKTNNYQNQQLLNPTCGKQETNALKEYNKCLNNNNKILKEIYKESEKIISRLNELNNTHYRYNSDETLKLIKARLNEGYTTEDLLLVVEKMSYLWNRQPKNNEKDMRPYLRPSTLFRKSNFENYLNMPVSEKNTINELTDEDDFLEYIERR